MDLTDDSIDPHDAIVRLETQIEALAGTIESCRKLMLAARIALVLGAIGLGLTLVGLAAFDPRVMLASIAAVLGGLVLLGSNTTTAREAAEERAKAQAQRDVLIGSLELRVVRGPETLH